jgi:uncharacterized membrane protein
MSTCCGAAGGRKTSARLRKTREVAAWLVPSVALALMPKCPVCLAAYVAIWTGIGLSLTTAAYLRWSLLIICVASLLYLVAMRGRRILTLFRQFKKETRQCNTK